MIFFSLNSIVIYLFLQFNAYFLFKSIEQLSLDKINNPGYLGIFQNILGYILCLNRTWIPGIKSEVSDVSTICIRIRKKVSQPQNYDEKNAVAGV